jgi:hypothetical protein
LSKNIKPNTSEGIIVTANIAAYEAELASNSNIFKFDLMPSLRMDFKCLNDSTLQRRIAATKMEKKMFVILFCDDITDYRMMFYRIA